VVVNHSGNAATCLQHWSVYHEIYYCLLPDSLAVGVMSLAENCFHLYRNSK